MIIILFIKSMNTKESKRSIIVGVFVLLGIIVLLAGVLVLGSQQNKFSKNIDVTTYFKDVKGLKVGNNVWFSGVRVGIVKEIKFEGIENVRVLMHVEEKSREYIRKDVHAKLGSDGLIGNSIITLVGGSSSMPSIESGDIVVSEGGVDVEVMMNTLQANNENLVAITENFVTISHDLASGKGLAGAILTDESLVTGLKKAVSGLNTTIEGANEAVNNLTSLTTKLNNDQGLIHDLTTDTLVFANLKQSADQLQQVTVTAATMMQSLNQMSERLNEKDNIVGVLTNDGAAAEEIKQILRNLSTSTEKLDQNMEALQHNFLFRRYFRKLDK